MKKLNLVMTILMSVCLILTFATSATAWMVTEHATDWDLNYTKVFFEIENDHPTNSIIGFGVGMSDWATSNFGGYLAPTSASDWQICYRTPGNWGTTGMETMFGLTWSEAFGDYNFGFLAWTETSTWSIGPGETFGDGVFDDKEEFCYYVGLEGWPDASPPAIVLLDGGGIAYSGETGQQNAFPDPVPEPATVLLLGFGLVGLVGIRRKFKK